MRRARFLTSLMLSMFTIGCSEMKMFGGANSNSTVRGQNGEKLTLVKPHDQNIERGGTENVTIVLHRKNLDEPINVSIGQLPSGVEAVDSPREVSGNETQIVLRASDSAALVANQQVEVLAEGPNGMRTTETFRLTVKERRS